MRIKATLLIMTFMSFMITGVTAEEEHHQMMEHGGHGHMEDNRISLNLPPGMKQHQLANMRNHLDAIRRIISAISEDDYENASKIASSELGLTTTMMNMCNKFKNEKFREMGLSFHKSADDMAEILKKGDFKESMQAIDKTMSYCVACHSTFKQ